MLNTNQFTKINATFSIALYTRVGIDSGISTGTIYSYESANKIYDVIKIPTIPVRTIYQINLKEVSEPTPIHNEIKKFYNIP